MKHVILVLCVLSIACSESAPPQQSTIRELILEARSLAERNGDKVWVGFSDAPFGILLVEEQTERLYCHEGSPDDFQMTGIDPVLACSSGVRPTTFPTNMLASFPAVDGRPTIVIGTPEATGKTPKDWVLTILHEHFHQMQYAWPGYYQGTSDLNLSGDDESGMWMLNYPFPYDRVESGKAFSVMAERLMEALEARETDSFYNALEKYWQSRESARRTVSDADWRYMELQFWQEGVARWTEGAIAAISEGYSESAQQAEARIMHGLSELDLAAQRRTAVYPIGAAEALLLDESGSDWRNAYWSEPFSLGPQLKKLLAKQTPGGKSLD